MHPYPRIDTLSLLLWFVRYVILSRGISLFVEADAEILLLLEPQADTAAAAVIVVAPAPSLFRKFLRDI